MAPSYGRCPRSSRLFFGECPPIPPIPDPDSGTLAIYLKSYFLLMILSTVDGYHVFLPRIKIPSSKRSKGTASLE